ncbi:MAG: hypothetical protein ACRDLN_03600, partial [Solirubrobacteraceae bacterium]
LVPTPDPEPAFVPTPDPEPALVPTPAPAISFAVAPQTAEHSVSVVRAVILSAVVALTTLAGVTVAALSNAAGGKEREVLSVLTRYERAVQKKDYQTLCGEMYAADLVDKIRRAGLPCEVALRTGMENRKNPRLEVLSIDVSGDRAVAKVRSTAQGGRSSTDDWRLVHERGAWRLAAVADR